MRRRSLGKVLAAPVAAVGIAAGFAVAAPAASAQTVNLDTGGSVSITVPLSFVEQLAKAGIVEFPVPLSDLSVNTSNETATATFTVTGGDADVSIFYGSLDLSGSVDVGDANGNLLTLGGLQLDVEGAELVATPAGSSTPVVLLDLRDNTSQITHGTSSTTDVYDSSDLVVDPAGAAYLDSALGTSAFQAGQQVGTLSSSWTVVYPS
jgi:hypothetical protein